MVENVSSKSERRGSNNGSTARIIEIPHYPQGGGVRTLSVDRADDGGYLIRIAYANKRENRNEVQTMKLSEMEVTYLALRLLAEVMKIARS
jgi:hypothetical protein